MDVHAGKDGVYYSDFYMRHFAHTLDESPETRGFTKLKNDAQQIKFVLNVMKKIGASLDVKKYEKKDNKKSVDYRNAGNKMYAANCSENFRDIAEEYTKSIVYALPGSEELAMAYANRSALFFTNQLYSECLLDIERALQHNYPNEMKAKLYARRVRCLASLGDKSSPQLEEAIEDTRKWLLKMDPEASGREMIEKTLEDESHMAVSPRHVEPEGEKVKVDVPTDNPRFTDASSAIQISYSREWGRHITATRDINAGEILAVQKMYCTELSREATYRYCAHCQADAVSAIPCDHCVNVVYCTAACREAAWSDCHEIECQVLSPMAALKSEPIDFLKLRITIKAVKEAGGFAELRSLINKLSSVSDPKHKGLTDGVYDSTKYAAVAAVSTDNQAHFESGKQFLTCSESIYMAYMLATRSKFFGRKFSNYLYIFEQNKDILFVAELIKKHYLLFAASFTNQHLPDNTEVHGIAPILTLFNHSCETSIATVYRTRITIYALKPIKKGEQIFDCYGPHSYGAAIKEIRQGVLKNNYQVICKCIPCQQNWPIFCFLPEVSNLSKEQVNPDAARLIENTRQDCERLQRKNLTDKDHVELSRRIIYLMELLWKHVRIPCSEKYWAQRWLRECYKDILERL